MNKFELALDLIKELSEENYEVAKEADDTTTLKLYSLTDTQLLWKLKRFSSEDELLQSEAALLHRIFRSHSRDSILDTNDLSAEVYQTLRERANRSYSDEYDSCMILAAARGIITADEFFAPSQSEQAVRQHLNLDTLFQDDKFHDFEDSREFLGLLREFQSASDIQLSRVQLDNLHYSRTPDSITPKFKALMVLAPSIPSRILETLQLRHRPISSEDMLTLLKDLDDLGLRWGTARVMTAFLRRAIKAKDLSYFLEHKQCDESQNTLQAFGLLQIVSAHQTSKVFLSDEVNARFFTEQACENLFDILMKKKKISLEKLNFLQHCLTKKLSLRSALQLSEIEVLFQNPALISSAEAAESYLAPKASAFRRL